MGEILRLLLRHLETGKYVFLELDVKGALNIKKLYPDSVLIFIEPPSFDELIKRLKKRNTDTEADFKKRIERAEMELSLKDKFDYFVVNNFLDKAVLEVKKIIEKNKKENMNAT